MMNKILKFIMILIASGCFLFSTSDITNAGFLDTIIRGTAKSVKSVVKKRVTGGSSVVLAARIGTTTMKGWAAHHIIPIQLRNHRTLQKIGFDLDIKRNGIGLPNKPGIDPFLPIHAGSHPNYTAAVARALDEIPKNLSETETRKRVNEVIDMFRKKLESGIPLHRQEGMANPWK